MHVITPIPKPFVAYDVTTNNIALFENPYGFDYDISIMIINLGYKGHWEFIGEF